MDKKWIGVDLDGTLAKHLDWRDDADRSIGEPVMPMVYRVQQWLREGWEVRIVTARAAYPKEGEIAAIVDWCREHIGQELQVTAMKDPMMLELWDDRAIQVERNTGVAHQWFRSRLPGSCLL